MTAHADPANVVPLADAPDAGPERHLEVETKLDVGRDLRLPAPTDHAAARAAGVVSADEPSVRHLVATYFDTDRLDLLRSRLTLRRRTGGADAGWHLKLPAGDGARTEVRLPLSAGDPSGDEVPGALAAWVVGAARGRDLVPVARIETVRSARLLRDHGGRSLLEVADDSVSGFPLLPDAAGAERWRELEVELTGGTAEQATAVVEALLAAGARPAAAASKLGRLLGVPAPPVPDSATPAAPESAAAVLAQYLDRQRGLLIDADIRLRAPDPDGEAPHDARAAARRIRSVLRVYRPLMPSPEAASVAARLRGLGRLVSDVRDLDVARARFATVGVDADERAPLDRRLALRREAALGTLRAEMADDSYLELLRDLDRLLAGPPAARAASTDPESVLTPLVTAAWLALRADAEAALSMPPGGIDPSSGAGDRTRTVAGDDQFHRTRKDAKSVRYAAESAAGMGGEPGAIMARFAATVERIQEILGAFQDAVSARALMAVLAAEPGISPVERDLLGRWRHAESAAMARALAEFRAMWPLLPLLPGDGRDGPSPQAG